MLNKAKPGNKENLVITETPLQTFDQLQIDTYGPLLTSNNGFKYILTSQCELSKYLILTPLKDKSADSIAKAIFKDIILKFGPPKAFKSDNGTEFINSIFSSLCKLMKIDHKRSVPFHHETLGQIEKSHKELNVYLRGLTDPEKLDWDEWLGIFEFCYNTTPNSYHSYTPFELLYGRKMNHIDEVLQRQVSPIYNHDDYIKIIEFQMKMALERARKILMEQKAIRQKLLTKIPMTFQIGQQVLLKNENRQKLDPFYKGPYTLIEIYNNNNAKIRDKNNKDFIVHRNNIINA
jgi:hypothetical protein